MSNYKNYKWVKLDDYYTVLRNDDFSSVPNFEVNDINPLLMEKLEKNGIDIFLEGDGFLDDCRYVLTLIEPAPKSVTITAPLYEFDINSRNYVLLSKSHTQDVSDPDEYDLVKAIYFRCCEEVAKEQASIFEKLFEEKSSDNISSFVTISTNPHRDPNYFYEEYIPDGYITICRRHHPFLYERFDYVFIKKFNANGRIVTIKIPDLYKGLVIGKNGENIKKIANMINARKIIVI